MIRFVTGLPGAGKGVYTVIKSIEELQMTDRPIITNFAFELRPWRRKTGRNRSRGEKGMLAHLEDTYGGETFDASRRIHCLEDEDMKEFYLWRCDENYKLVKISVERDRDGSINSIDNEQFAKTMPCCYIADEAWKFWNSRQWAKMDKGMQFYNAQHRKCGDDVWVTAQSSSQIDKQMRVLVQEYHTLVNHGYRKFLWFKQPAVITCFTSNEPPEARNKTIGASPQIIRFDKLGIGSCFDTARGAGVQGVGADLNRKMRGLPAWGIPLLFILPAVGLVMAARGMGWGAGKLLTQGAETRGGYTTVTNKPIVVAQSHGSTESTNAYVRREISRTASVTNEPAFFEDVVGFAQGFGVPLTVYTESGRVFKSGDGRLSYVNPKTGMFVIDGKVHYFKPVTKANANILP